jgi:hypothetical protein
MANVLDRNFDFLTNGTVTAAGLHNLIDETNIYAGLISTQEEKTTVGTSDLLLVADSSSIGSPQIAANRTTVYNLFDDALTGGTYANAQLSGNLTYGTATGGRTISTSATITNGTIANLTSSTANITLGTIPTLTTGTTTSTAANITNGTIQTLTASTATIANGTYSGLINSSTGTYSGLINSSTGTYSGAINSTSGTITNLTTTLAGDLTISQGTATASTATVAKLASAQEYTATHNFNATTLTSGTSIAWALPSNQVSRLVLSTNGTMADATGKVDGATYILIVTQGTGSNTLSWNATYKWPGATAPTLTTGSGVSDIFTFVSNGTSMFGVSSQNYA